MSYKDTRAPLESLLHYLSEYDRKALLKLIENSKATPHWYSTNSFNAKYKGIILYRLRIFTDGHWGINLTLAYPRDLDETLLSLPKGHQDFYFRNFRKCKHCNSSHGNGKRFVILGNEYFGCAEPEVEMNNPSMEDIDILTEFVKIRKENISRYK